MHGSRHDPLIAFLVGSIGIAAFSAMDAVMKGLVLAIGTYLTVFWRSIAGTIFAGGFFAFGPRWPDSATMRIHVARGMLSSVMAVLFFWGLARVPIAQAIALAFIAPLLALYLAAATLNEHVERRTKGASLVAFGGVIVIFVGQTRADVGREAMLGSLSIVASACCYAMNIVLMRRQAMVAGPVEVGFFQNLFMAVGLVLAMPIMGGPGLPPIEQIPMILLAAALATISLWLLTWAYARAQASYLAATEYTSFLWAALFGWLFFAEAVSLFTIAGAMLIVAGCVLAARRPEEASPSLEAAT